LSDKREPVGDRNRKIARILARDGDNCCYCKKPLGDDMTLEHRIALSNGGTDNLDNLKLAHAACNREVGNLPPDMKDELVERKKRSETLG
jgi:5-methylcytosine-specific restriction endonuclease McrA